MAHAKLSPSASKRWMNCPGSVALSAGIPERTSTFAEEGTAAHALAEHCLKHGYAAERFESCYVWLKDGDDPEIVDFPPESMAGRDSVWPVTTEMVEAVQLYLDTCRAMVKPGDEWEAEVKVKAADGIWGTADFVRYRPATCELAVVDFKYGRGVPVEPKENTQGLIYALGAVKAKHNRGLSSVEVVIVQPRCPHHEGPARRCVCDPLDLMDFEVDLRAAADRTQKPDAPVVAGEWCQFCRAAGVCSTLREKALSVAQADADEMVVSLPEPPSYSPERLAMALQEIGIVEDWCKRVREFAHAEATAGRPPPGWKLVAGRATRKWRDEETVPAELERRGLDKEHFLKAPELKSPTQIETELRKHYGYKGKAAGDVIADLVEKTSGATVLAPAEDPREEICRIGAAEEFGSIQD